MPGPRPSSRQGRPRVVLSIGLTDHHLVVAAVGCPPSQLVGSLASIPPTVVPDVLRCAPAYGARLHPRHRRAHLERVTRSAQPRDRASTRRRPVRRSPGTSIGPDRARDPPQRPPTGDRIGATHDPGRQELAMADHLDSVDGRPALSWSRVVAIAPSSARTPRTSAGRRGRSRGARPPTRSEPRLPPDVPGRESNPCCSRRQRAACTASVEVADPAPLGGRRQPVRRLPSRGQRGGRRRAGTDGRAVRTTGRQGTPTPSPASPGCLGRGLRRRRSTGRARDGCEGG